MRRLATHPRRIRNLIPAHPFVKEKMRKTEEIGGNWTFAFFPRKLDIVKGTLSRAFVIMTAFPMIFQFAPIPLSSPYYGLLTCKYFAKSS
jgi:hypothetical protein